MNRLWNIKKLYVSGREATNEQDKLLEDAVGEFYRLWVLDGVIFESFKSGHADSSWTLTNVLK